MPGPERESQTRVAPVAAQQLEQTGAMNHTKARQRHCRRRGAAGSDGSSGSREEDRAQQQLFPQAPLISGKDTGYSSLSN